MKKIYFKEYGGGYPLIFLHGFCETNFIWNGVAEELKNDFKVITIDLPGFGESPLLPNSFSLDQVAQLIHKKLKDLNIDKCILIGHSLGGYITNSFARQFPEILDGYCLFNSTVFADTPDKKENRNKLIELIKASGTAAFIQTFIPSLFFDQRVTEFKDVINQLKEIGKNISPEAVIKYAAAMRDRRDEADTLLSNKDKALIIAGKEDKNITEDISTKMSQMINPENFHLLEKTAHMSMFEGKEKAISIIKDFALKTQGK